MFPNERISSENLFLKRSDLLFINIFIFSFNEKLINYKKLNIYIFKYIYKFDNYKYEYFYTFEFSDFFTDFLFLLKIKHRQKVIK